MMHTLFQPDYKRDGYILIPEFMTKEEMAELAHHLDRYIRETVPELPATHAFYQDRSRPETLKQLQFMEEDPFFEELPKRDKWLNLAEDLVGEPVNPSVRVVQQASSNSSRHSSPPGQLLLLPETCPCGHILVGPRFGG